MSLLETLRNPGSRLLVEWGDEDKIKLIQRALKILGKNIAIDGEFGPITAAAIKGVNNRALHQTIWEIEHPPNVPDDLPKWLRIAINEIGVKEIHGPTHNPRVLEYMHATKWGTWVRDDETPWCAGFVGWVMVQAGYEDQIPDYSLGAKSWLNFGKSAHRPVLGAIAVKSRKGGGHVGFVVGATPDGEYLYILGGNQSDAVCVKKYPARVWIDYRIPTDYHPSTPKLAEWHGIAGLGGEEA